MSKEAEHANKVREFILRLAADTSRGDKEIVGAIADQLEGIEQNRFFPEIVDNISPERYHSETKILSKKEKYRLHQALEEYSKRKERYR